MDKQTLIQKYFNNECKLDDSFEDDLAKLSIDELLVLFECALNDESCKEHNISSLKAGGLIIFYKIALNKRLASQDIYYVVSDDNLFLYNFNALALFDNLELAEKTYPAYQFKKIDNYYEFMTYLAKRDITNFVINNNKYYFEFERAKDESKNYPDGKLRKLAVIYNHKFFYEGDYDYDYELLALLNQLSIVKMNYEIVDNVLYLTSNFKETEKQFNPELLANEDINEVVLNKDEENISFTREFLCDFLNCDQQFLNSWDKLYVVYDNFYNGRYPFILDESLRYVFVYTDYDLAITTFTKDKYVIKELNNESYHYEVNKWLSLGINKVLVDYGSDVIHAIKYDSGNYLNAKINGDILLYLQYRYRKRKDDFLLYDKLANQLKDTLLITPFIYNDANDKLTDHFIHFSKRGFELYKENYETVPEIFGNSNYSIFEDGGEDIDNLLSIINSETQSKHCCAFTNLYYFNKIKHLFTDYHLALITLQDFREYIINSKDKINGVLINPSYLALNLTNSIIDDFLEIKEKPKGQKLSKLALYSFTGAVFAFNIYTALIFIGIGLYSLYSIKKENMQGKVFAYLGIGIALLFGIIGSFILKVNDLKVIIALTLVALSSYVLIELFIKLFAKNREEV